MLETDVSKAQYVFTECVLGVRSLSVSVSVTEVATVVM